MLLALIGLPAVTLVVGVIVIWSFESSIARAHRQQAQIAADRVYDEAMAAIEREQFSDAIRKLRVYVSEENATRGTEAAALLQQMELATSQDAALNTVVQMTDETYSRFQQSKHFDDQRVRHPILVTLWDETLLSALPAAKKRREEAQSQRVAEMEWQKAEAHAASRSPPTYQGFTEAELKKVYEELLRQGYDSDEALLTVKSMLDYPDTKATMRQYLDRN